MDQHFIFSTLRADVETSAKLQPDRSVRFSKKEFHDFVALTRLTGFCGLSDDSMGFESQTLDMLSVSITKALALIEHNGGRPYDTFRNEEGRNKLVRLNELCRARRGLSLTKGHGYDRPMSAEPVTAPARSRDASIMDTTCVYRR